MKKIKPRELLIYSLTFILFLILANAKGYSTSPFGSGCLFALMWVGLYLPVIATEYLLSNIIFMNKLADIYSSVAVVFILIVAYLLHRRNKKPMNIYLIGLYMLIGQVVALYYVCNVGGWLDALIFGAVSIIFLYVCISVFQVCALRGGLYKLTTGERVCLSLLVMVMSFGIADIYIADCALYKFVAVLIILLCTGARKPNQSIVMGASIGLGVSIATSNLVVAGELAIISVIVNIFDPSHKYKIATITMLSAIGLQLYFVGLKFEIIYQLIPIVCATAVFLMISKKSFKKLANNYYDATANLSVRNLINCAKKNIKQRLGNLSDVFTQMQQIHLKMMQDELSRPQAIELLAGELSKSVCTDCKRGCYKLQDKSSIYNLIDIALQKGKITILDLPTQIAQKCEMVNLMISKINQMSEQYRKQCALLKDINNVKFLLADHTGAVGRLLLDIERDFDKNIEFESDLQAKIISALLSKNIICSEVLIFNEKAKGVSVVAIIKGENAYNPEIEKIISKIVRVPLRVESVEPTEFSNYFSVDLVRACKRDITFGISSRTKTGSTNSGDSHTLIRLGGNRYLLALCDGMGSGESAREMSALTIALVENFYKAGFKDGFILNNINKLLATNNQENYSTLDLCVLDLNNETIDFIKMGATYGAIKRENEVDKVEAGALPLGVLGEVKADISHYVIGNKDMIIMVTDGITDAFGSFTEFANFVNAIVSTNPQVVAQTILDEAVALYGGTAKDDMTVLVTRTFLKG